MKNEWKTKDNAYLLKKNKNKKLKNVKTFFPEDDHGNAVDFRGETGTFSNLIRKSQLYKWLLKPRSFDE